MNKIMIVDDMPIFLEYLRGCIDWESYGFEICCEAHDGKEALEKMGEYYPDVVLTDITMPYLNGLELSEAIVRDYPESSIILITGNNEFEYARRAVKLGVCDYIVKPFEKEELILSLLKLKDNIGRAVEDGRPEPADADEESLKKLLYASNTKDSGAWLKELGLSEGFPFLTLFSFEMPVNGSREQLMNWERIIARMLKDKIEINGKSFLFHDYENNLAVLQIFEKEVDLREYKGYEFADIAGVVKNQLSIDVKALSGVPEGGLAGIRALYEKMLILLRKGQSVKHIDLREAGEGTKSETGPHVSLEAIARLNNDIETLNADDAEAVLREIWSIMSTSNHPGASVNLLSGAVSILMTNILNEGLSVEAVYGKGFSPEKALERAAGPDRFWNVLLICIVRE
ncbi:MAG: response regulator [Lachnospiraceae bacterium]|nr:response regulator [Lachnospiraceae bacterium]